MRQRNKPGEAHRVLPLHLYHGIYSKTICFHVRRRPSNIHDWDLIKKDVQELKSEKDKVTQWYKVNLLKANPSKYQIIAIDPKLFLKEFVDKLLLQIDNQVVKSLDKLTILGVNIVEKLTFSEHRKTLTKELVRE